MKRVRQIIAIIGIILLIALYVAALVLAFMDGERAQTMMRIAIFCTFVVPIMLWVYTFIFKLVKDKKDK